MIYSESIPIITSKGNDLANLSYFPANVNGIKFILLPLINFLIISNISQETD